MSSNSWSHSGGTIAEESKPGGELYSIKRDGDHCCGVVELGRGRVTQQLTRQGRPIPRLQPAACTPPPRVGLIHCDALSCLWGKMSTPSLPLYHGSPYSGLGLPSPLLLGQSLERWWSSAGGWCCGFEVTDGRVWRQLSFVARWLGRPIWVMHVRAVMFWTRMSKWTEGGGVLRETSSAAAKASFQQTQLSLNILGSEFLQRCDVLWQRIDFILIDAMTATLSRVHQNIVFI